MSQCLNFELVPKLGYHKYKLDARLQPLSIRRCSIESFFVGKVTADRGDIIFSRQKEKSVSLVDLRLLSATNNEDVKNGADLSHMEPREDVPKQPLEENRAPSLRDLVWSSSSSEDLDIVTNLNEVRLLDPGSEIGVVKLAPKNSFLDIPAVDLQEASCSRSFAVTGRNVSMGAPKSYGFFSRTYIVQQSHNQYGYHGEKQNDEVPPEATNEPASAKVPAAAATHIPIPSMMRPPPCICRPNFPELGICSHPEIATDVEEEERNYCKICLLWVGFFSKLLVFLALWGILMYFFIATGGFVNVVPTPLILSTDLNTYIDPEDSYKVLIINSTRTMNKMSLLLKGPFMGHALLYPKKVGEVINKSWTEGRNLQWQFERFYYLYDAFDITDPDRNITESVEVNHYTISSQYSYGSTRYVKTPHILLKSLVYYSSIIGVRTTSYCLSYNYSMINNGIDDPVNFVVWEKPLVVSHNFENFERGGVPGRYFHWHRHLANFTEDSDLKVIYAWRYGLFWDISPPETVAFSMQVLEGIDPELTTTTSTAPPPIVVKSSEGIMYAGALLGLMLLLILLQTHQTLIILMVSIATVSVLSYLKVRPDHEEMCRWFDMDYIMRVLFVMLLVAVTSDTGLFDVIATFTAQVLARKNFVYLIIILCLYTWVASMQMENIMAMLVMTPIAIRSCEELHLNPKPILHTIGIYSNLASLQNNNSFPNKEMWASWTWTEVAFAKKSFFWIMGPGAIFCHILAILYLGLLFWLRKPHKYKSPYIAELEHEQRLWIRLSESVYRSSQGAWHVGDVMVSQYHELERLMMLGLPSEPENPDPNVEDERVQDSEIRDKVMLGKVLFTILVGVVMKIFRYYSIASFGQATDGFLAALCTGTLLILVNPTDMNYVLWRIDWSTMFTLLGLIYFKNALVLLHVEDDVLNKVKHKMIEKIHIDPKQKNKIVNIVSVLVMWVCAALSALVSNIASSDMMIKTVISLADTINDKYDKFTAECFSWAICFGGNLGGAMTGIGSCPVMVYMTSAAQQGYRITLCEQILFVAPLMLFCLFAVSLTFYFSV